MHFSIGFLLVRICESKSFYICQLCELFNILIQTQMVLAESTLFLNRGQNIHRLTGTLVYMTSDVQEPKQIRILVLVLPKKSNVRSAAVLSRVSNHQA